MLCSANYYRSYILLCHVMSIFRLQDLVLRSSFHARATIPIPQNVIDHHHQQPHYPPHPHAHHPSPPRPPRPQTRRKIPQSPQLLYRSTNCPSPPFRQCPKRGIDRYAPEEWHPTLIRHHLATALAEDIRDLVAAGTHVPRHIFDHADDGHGGFGAEVEFLADVRGGDCLRGGDDYGAG